MRKKIIYTNVRWFSAADEPETENTPKALSDAYLAWESNGEEASQELCASLNNFVSCTFVAENMQGWEHYFVSENFGEFLATKVKVAAFEYSDSILPLICAEAWIEVELLQGVSDEAIDEWIEDQGGLESAVIWSWIIPDNDETDLTMEEHAGAEAMWVNEIPSH